MPNHTIPQMALITTPGDYSWVIAPPCLITGRFDVVFTSYSNPITINTGSKKDLLIVLNKSFLLKLFSFGCFFFSSFPLFLFPSFP